MEGWRARHLLHRQVRPETPCPMSTMMDPADPPAAVGAGRLEVFANTPRLNEWLYSKLAAGVRGDVLEIGSGIGNLSRLIARTAERLILSDVEPHYLEALRRT